MGRTHYALLVFVLAGCGPRNGQLRLVGEDPRLDGVAWLCGSWAGVLDQTRIEEHWSAPAGGTMIGMSRTVAGGRTLFYEYLRIEVGEDDGIVYWAAPRGRQPPTPFVMRSLRDRQVVFENLEHDFPQRIIYRRDDETLHARIEGEDEGEQRSSEWTMLRATIATLE